MGIREYKEGEHPAGFVGLRVVRSVAKKYKQKYFNFKKAESTDLLWSEARTLDFKWAMEQSIFLAEKNKAAKEVRPRSPYITGVCGIKMKFIVDKTRKHKKWYAPVFIVQGSEKADPFHSRFRIKKLGFEEAWRQAVMFYAEKKSISDPKPLLDRRPSPLQFTLIYRYQTENGWDIPLSQMPVEVLTNFGA